MNWRVTSSDGVEFSVVTADTRWDLFNDRFAEGEVDSQLVVHVPYPSDEVAAWCALDTAMRQEDRSTPVSYNLVKRVAIFMSPKLREVHGVYVADWLLYCKVELEEANAPALTEQGRVIRSGPRPTYLTSPALFTDLGMSLDPIYRSDDGSVLSCDWMNTTTGIVHTYWLSGMRTRELTAGLFTMDWRFILKLVGSRWRQFKRRCREGGRVDHAIAHAFDLVVDKPHLDCYILAGVIDRNAVFTDQWDGRLVLDLESEESKFILQQTAYVLTGYELEVPTDKEDRFDVEQQVLYSVGLGDLYRQEDQVFVLTEHCSRQMNPLGSRAMLFDYFRHSVYRLVDNATVGAMRRVVRRLVEELGVPVVKVLVYVLRFYLKCVKYKNKKAHRFVQYAEHLVAKGR